MSTKSAILKLLESRRGENISGEYIANQLGVSRNAVWKGIKELKKQGYAIEGITNRGYCLSVLNDLLSAEAIGTFLEQPHDMENIQVYKTIDSTNNLAKRVAIQGAKHGFVVISEGQTQGRGRKGREFYSPSNQGIYMSLILRPKLSVKHALIITAAAAVLVAQALEEVKDCQIKIKWVNDLYLEDKKICGILTEAASDWESGDVEYIILGIGINIIASQTGFPPNLQDIADSLFSKNEKPVLRNQIVASIINKIRRFTDQLEDDFAATTKSIIDQYRLRSNVLSKPINIIGYPGLTEGLAVDIDENGFLVVEDVAGQKHKLSSGEISIKSLEKNI